MSRIACVLAAITLTAGLASCAHTTRAPKQAVDARAQNSAKARELAAQADAAAKSGSLDKAVELYRMSLANNPDFGQVWHELGLTLMKRKKDTDLVQAGQALTQAAGLLPQDPTPPYNLGVLYQMQGFEDDALKHFQDALAIDPYHLDSLRGAARAGKVLHRSDTATLDRLKRAQMIEKDPTWRDIITRERIRVENDLREAEGHT